MGFGANTRLIHTFKIERLSLDLSIIIEVLGTMDKVEDFLSFIETHIHSGLLATLQKVDVRFSRLGESFASTTPPQ